MSGTVKIVVRHGWAVFHDGRQRVGGETIAVSVDTAAEWLSRGWADPAAKTPRSGKDDRAN